MNKSSLVSLQMKSEEFLDQKIWEKISIASFLLCVIVIFVSTQNMQISRYFVPACILPMLVNMAFRKWDLVFRAIPDWLLFTAIFLQVSLFGYNIYLEYYSLSINFFDTGFFWNPIANFSNGRGFYNSELQKSEFADHFCPGLLLIFTPLFSIFKNGIALHVIRLVFFSFSILWFHNLLNFYGVSSGKRNFLLLLWVINVGVVNFLGFEFQSSNLIVPFVFLLFHYYQLKKYVLFLLLSLFILSLKENGSLVLISLGLFSIVYLNRIREGIVITFFGVLCLYAIPRILMPLLSGSEGVNDLAFDPFCCLREKLTFVLLVLMCSGLFLIFYPKAILVVLPSMAASLLINRTGAHSLGFHYQDIPLAVSFAVLGFVVSKEKGVWPEAILKFPVFRIIAVVLFAGSFYRNHYSANNYVQNYQITRETRAAIEAIGKFKEKVDEGSTIWAQTSLAFYLSNEYNIRCIMNENQTMMDTASNYIVLCDFASDHWPIRDHYEQMKNRLRLDVRSGIRKELSEYYPLLIFERN